MPVGEETRREVIARFRSVFRRTGPETPANLPTACTFPFALDEDPAVALHSRTAREVFVLFEHSADLRRTSVPQLLSFLKERQPWENTDICVFDDTFSWCVGLTHNDRVTACRRQRESGSS